MQIKITVFAFALSIAATGTLLAIEIYKWTDEEGNVHFGDLPTGAAGEEHLAIRSRPTDPAGVQAEAQTLVDARTLSAEEETNAPQGPTREALRAEAREREEKCNKYRDRQTSFTRSRRIYQLDDNGERVYYDEQEMQVARTELDGLVEEYCD